MSDFQQCQNCRFFLQAEDAHEGECRRFPPTFAASREQQEESIKALGACYGIWRGWWPMTSAEDWCGEWKAIANHAQKSLDLKSSVFSLNMDVRCKKAMHRLSIGTIGDLLSKTPSELLKLKNFGHSSLLIIRRSLREQGLSLRDDDDWDA